MKHIHGCWLFKCCVYNVYIGSRAHCRSEWKREWRAWVWVMLALWLAYLRSFNGAFYITRNARRASPRGEQQWEHTQRATIYSLLLRFACDRCVRVGSAVTYLMRSSLLWAISLNFDWRPPHVTATRKLITSWVNNVCGCKLIKTI